MKRTLGEACKALKGLVAMSTELEALCDAIFDNVVPAAWAAKAYPSLKPLAAWVADLLQRCAFIGGWIARGPPAVFWISGFFFPQAFLTGTLQNFARAHGHPIDTCAFTYIVRSDVPFRAPAADTSGDDDGNSGGAESAVEAPEDGCFIGGLFMEGARWDAASGALAESRPKELFTPFPVIWLKPVARRPGEGAAADAAEAQGLDASAAAARCVYECPVYKTLTRAGTLSTTGHSTNFVMDVGVPSAQPARHWVNRGAALFCALAS